MQVSERVHIGAKICVTSESTLKVFPFSMHPLLDRQLLRLGASGQLWGGDRAEQQG